MRRTNHGALLMRLAVLSLLAQGGGAFHLARLPAARRSRATAAQPPLVIMTVEGDTTAARVGERSYSTPPVEGVVVPAPLAKEADEGYAPRSLLVLGLCCLIGSVCALDRVMISVAILPMGAEFGYSDSTKGLVAAGFSVGYCLGLFPAGFAASTGSPKVVLGGGLLIWSVAQALTPAAAALGVQPLCAMRAVMGVGEAAAVPCLQSLAANFVPASQRAQFWGLLTACLSLGTISAYVLSPAIIDSQGWPAAFTLFGGAGGLLACLWLLCGADSPDDPSLLARLGGSGDNEGAAGEAAGAPVPAAAAAAEEEVPWREMAASRPVWAMAAAHMSNNFFGYFALSWLPTYFNYEFGLSANDAASASLVPFVAGAVGSLSAGTVCDALVARGLSLTRARKVMQGVSCLGPAAAMLLLAALGEHVGGATLDRASAEALFVAALALQSCFAAGYGCGAQDISTKYASLIYGATSVFAVLAGASGQYFTGWLLEANGRDFSPMFLITAIIEVAGFVAWNSWWRSDRLFD